MNLAHLPWIFQFNMRNDAGQTVERSVALHVGQTYHRYDNQVTGAVKYFRAPRDAETRVDFDQLVEVDANDVELCEPTPPTQRSEARR